ncbi:nicotinate phosphoribosyltransferase [Pasteurella skyensis]|uniref:Nicotinamide phosphoribosyltransferase n=1 Tax=Phocoenobacter skyensis TaxID=97481 RepID=A0AAJ6N7Z1_9PAST|nr:nicotinate phosphoribosyltransferase [Pasteurella skyensis]MDP8161719.1 nicotinate phosphoribosyltransferase [Pasteurella skyensis]MDP8171875.1 nicotinate phosphoribosyltransferase [Pasteurella skyensis]MDP8176113.1 nicotinate phosphoribosyltransferase [Pasteurella skyensis]MDP8178130.1 nicotinate phosphoribosyltransferase [Pasteurella skyensis]MDP8182262.1 nicotinate phosphoribosyltransferase [Pasteurella skyensis]
MYTSNLNNLILNTDSYKASHWVQYPPQSEYISSYIESRKSDFDVVFFGLQAFIKEYLSKPITLQDIEEAEMVFTAHGEPFNKEGWLKIIEKYQGYLPIKIQAVPEGSVIPTSNVVCQIINTDPEFYWLPSYLETALLRAIWYPSTVASISYYCKQIIKQALEKSADNLDSLPFKLHDFGARGASSLETVALGGLAHLVNFCGTDSVSALVAARRWYNVTEMPAFSIPAAEHSTITSWGREGEIAAYQNMLNQFGGEGKIFAVVSDSYNLWDVVSDLWGGQFKEQIIEMGGTLVVRPDSGKPSEVVCKTLELLEQKFGSTINNKGYKVLPDCIRVIQGDGIDRHSLKEILYEVMELGFSAENVTFGMGGGLLQKVHRDTMNWAMKTSAIQVAGQWRDVYKDPITAHSKRSKKGRLALVKQDNKVQTIREELLDTQQNLLQTVYLNGKLLIEEEFTTIRERTNVTL